MDGARWFGVGHWFVGIGYDAGGIYIRDSSDLTTTVTRGASFGLPSLRS